MPDSRKQVRLAHAVDEGASNSGMPVSVAREIIRKMHGKKMSSLPEKVESPTKKVLKRLS